MSLPHWKDVAGVIPEDFRYDGASSPFRFLYPLLYDRTTRTAIAIAARVHDYGYGPARLLGSPEVPQGGHLVTLSMLDRSDWDRLYTTALAAMGHSRVARAHYWAVRKFGKRAWHKNGERMKAQGLRNYGDWLDSR